MSFDLEPAQRLSKDLKNAAITMEAHEARFLVDSYYTMQDNRIRAAGQVRAMKDEPHQTLAFFKGQAQLLEGQIKRALDSYSLSTKVGVWSRSICGVGPVMAAGLMAHIDINRCPTVGHIWSYGGLNPLQEWKKGEKRPWNADLKTLFWKLGESFVKVKGRESDFYGKLYETRKAYEQEKNARGEYAGQAKHILETKNFRNDTKAKATYKEGHLPDGHIHARAKRYAVKIFLAHWHHVAYENAFKQPPPKPYAISILGHAHEIMVPNYDYPFGRPVTP